MVSKVILAALISGCSASGNSLLQLSRVVQLPLARKDLPTLPSDESAGESSASNTSGDVESTANREAGVLHSGSARYSASAHAIAGESTQLEQQKLFGRLWAGEDLGESDMARLGTGRARSTDVSTTQTIPVQVLGLFNSGTNLLVELLKKNFESQVSFPAPIWKHVSLRRYADQFPSNYSYLSNYTAVAVVRNPVAWLQSLRKAPYDVQDCVEVTSWLTHECHFHVENEKWNLSDFELPNIEQWWNENTEDYTVLSKFGFKRTLVLRYEDLVLDTNASVIKLADLLGLQPPEIVQQVDEAAKDHGEPTGRSDAVTKIQEKTYLDLYSNGSGSSLTDACERLDAALQQRFQYHDCSQTGQEAVADQSEGQWDWVWQYPQALASSWLP